MFQLALITGASSGIGEALCELLASKGIKLILHGRDETRLKKLAEKLRSQVEVSSYIGDLINIEQRNTLIRVIRDRKPDLVINNAGFGLYGEAIGLDYHEQLSMVDLNIGALLELTVEAGRILSNEKHDGVILNVASVAGFYPFPYLATYAATKSFVIHFSEAVDFELRKKGIRVLVSCPGKVDTRFREVASKGRSTSSKKEFGVMDAKFVAEQIWWQIKKKKTVHIVDWKYRFGMFLLKLLPKSMAFRILSRSIQKR